MNNLTGPSAKLLSPEGKHFFFQLWVDYFLSWLTITGDRKMKWIRKNWGHGGGQVVIPLTTSVFSAMFVYEKTVNIQKEAGVGHF